MSTTSPTKKIRKIAVIDDDKEAREAMAEIVTDAIGKLNKEADAAIFDHRLTPRNYAAFQGAEAVAALYDVHFPALLVTAWSIEDIDNIRPYRRKIPVMIRSGGLESKIIRDSILKCLNEFRDNYTKERIPHRVLLRVEDVDTQFAYIIIPSWDPRNGLKLPKKIFPWKFGQVKSGIRLFAEVNIGALKNEDLYFDKFEIAEKPGNSYASLIRA
jgi:hypothetical protein